MPAFSLLARPARPAEAKTPPSSPSASASDKTSQEKAASAEDSHRPTLKRKKALRRQPKRQPASTPPANPLPTPSSTTSSITHPPTPTSTAPPLATISVLEDIITAEVTYWAHYLNTISTTTSFATLTTDATSTTPAELKAEALRQILEILPLRYRALSLAYPDADPASDSDADVGIKPGLLTPSLQLLLDSLQSPEQQAELDGWYDRKLFQSSRLRTDVLNLEDEIRRLEEARMEELKGLLVMVEEMKLAAADGLVGDDALKVLIEIMDEAGLSAAGLSSSSTPAGDTMERSVVAE